jgi:uncharacterized membrane protein YdjX (TVP38/TMEM64 family)
MDRRRAITRLLLLGAAIAVAFACLTVTGISPGDARSWIEESGPAGPLVFVLAGGALGLALFPGHVTATIAGVLFGALTGTALMVAVAVVGAALAWLLARRFGADAVSALLGPRTRRWRDWIADNGFMAVLASRLAPGVPGSLVNYAAGLSGIGVTAFLAAVALGSLPKTIAYVALGGALSDPLSSRGAVAAGLYLAAAGGGALAARHLFRSRPTPA